MDQPGAWDTRAFRAALGEFVTGVTIITTCDEAGEPVGLTANSFNSVSLDPPMVLFSLALGSTSLPAFRQAGWWAVHVLAADQEALSARFARSDVDKFEGLAHARGPGGIPLLEGFSARFVCRAALEYEGGDHAIFLGQVEEFDRAGRAPLIYHKGRYGGVLPGDSGEAEGDAKLDVLAQSGLIEGGAEAPVLTRHGDAVLRGFAALAARSGQLTPHERRALRTLLEKLSLAQR